MIFYKQLEDRYLVAIKRIAKAMTEFNGDTEPNYYNAITQTLIASSDLMAVLETYAFHKPEQLKQIRQILNDRLEEITKKTKSG